MPGAIPIFQSYPVGWTNPLTFRASAALPAGGAWDAAPTEFSVAGATSLRLALIYTRGAVGGAFSFQVEASPYAVAADAPAGASEWATQALYDAAVVVAGADTISLIQREEISYTSTGAAAEDFFPLPLPLAGLERLRIRACETGAVGTPGTLSIVGTLSASPS